VSHRCHGGRCFWDWDFVEGTAMKKLLVWCLLCFSAQAFALEVEGVKLEDRAQVGKSVLQLNGAGLRSVFIIKIYVAALYLESPKARADAVFADKGAKRIELHVVADETGSERFLNGFHKGIENNRDQAQLAKLKDRMDAFEKAFGSVKTVVRGDIIAFDWLPGVGTRITLNGKELGRIEGEDFYLALLSIWIGENPVKEGLKKELLGG
jgi:hypothetical protein